MAVMYGEYINNKGEYDFGDFDWEKVKEHAKENNYTIMEIQDVFTFYTLVCSEEDWLDWFYHDDFLPSKEMFFFGKMNENGIPESIKGTGLINPFTHKVRPLQRYK